VGFLPIVRNDNLAINLLLLVIPTKEESHYFIFMWDFSLSFEMTI